MSKSAAKSLAERKLEEVDESGVDRRYGDDEKSKKIHDGSLSLFRVSACVRPSLRVSVSV